MLNPETISIIYWLWVGIGVILLGYGIYGLARLVGQQTKENIYDSLFSQQASESTVASTRVAGTSATEVKSH